MPLYVLILIFIFIATSIGLAWFFIAHDRGEREPLAALWIAVGLGVSAAIGAGLIESAVIPAHSLLASRSLILLLISCLGVGVIEETLKFVPLATFLWKKRYFNEHTDGLIYFVLAGIGFGLPENILYTLQYGPRAALGRILLTPFFHAAITGMVGYALARAKVDHHSLWKVSVVFVGAILLHAFYDFGLLSQRGIYVLVSVLITLSLSVGLFVLYLKATDQDQAEGLSAVGHNSFCRACGYPNPRHYLHCTHCGQYA